LTNKISFELFELLNAALVRELEVSVQYMLQHTMWAGKTSISKGDEKLPKPTKFVASHKHGHGHGHGVSPIPSPSLSVPV
jgi:hypothetical protein